MPKIMTSPNLQSQPATWQAYLELCKPRVVALMLLTAIVGMCLATTPQQMQLSKMILATLGIAFSASSAAVINHLIDKHIDALMGRTKNRPIPTGRVSSWHASIFAVVLATVGTFILVKYINHLTAYLTLFTLVGYAGIYTLYLKHATPQNIVIGGAAGAAPPLLGWVAMTGHIGAESLLLVAIIFVWTPPHFWALAIHRKDDYARAEIPMLPNTHGVEYTKLHILLYSLLLFIVALLPFAIGMSNVVYLAGAIVLGLGFIYQAIRLKNSNESKYSWAMFRYSIYYLMLLFIFLLLDHYLYLGASS